MHNKLLHCGLLHLRNFALRLYALPNSARGYRATCMWINSHKHVDLQPRAHGYIASGYTWNPICSCSKLPRAVAYRVKADSARCPWHRMTLKVYWILWWIQSLIQSIFRLWIRGYQMGSIHIKKTEVENPVRLSLSYPRFHRLSTSNSFWIPDLTL
jgi:hypothetical protein